MVAEPTQPDPAAKAARRIVGAAVLLGGRVLQCPTSVTIANIVRQEHADQQAELARLRAALEPFAAVANGVPENWPGECKLRIDQRRDGSEYLSYHGIPEASLGLLPTITQWREAAEAGGDDA